MKNNETNDLDILYFIYYNFWLITPPKKREKKLVGKGEGRERPTYHYE